MRKHALFLVCLIAGFFLAECTPRVEAGGFRRFGPRVAATTVVAPGVVVQNQVVRRGLFRAPAVNTTVAFGGAGGVGAFGVAPVVPANSLALQAAALQQAQLQAAQLQALQLQQLQALQFPVAPVGAVGFGQPAAVFSTRGFSRRCGF